MLCIKRSAPQQPATCTCWSGESAGASAVIHLFASARTGYYAPSVKTSLETVQVDKVSLPVALGLWGMMWPVLAKVSAARCPCGGHGIGCVGQGKTGWQHSAQLWSVGSVAMALISAKLSQTPHTLHTQVKYEVLGVFFKRRDSWVQMGWSVFVNWVVGPWVMLGLAWMTLPDVPGYRNGIIIVGIAR